MNGLTETKREFHGIMKTTGARVFLGSMPMSDGEVCDFVKILDAAYRDERPGALRLGASVYSVLEFAGLQITPAPKETPNE